MPYLWLVHNFAHDHHPDWWLVHVSLSYEIQLLQCGNKPLAWRWASAEKIKKDTDKELSHVFKVMSLIGVNREVAELDGCDSKAWSWLLWCGVYIDDTMCHLGRQACMQFLVALLAFWHFRNFNSPAYCIASSYHHFLQFSYCTRVCLAYVFWIYSTLRTQCVYSEYTLFTYFRGVVQSYI